MIKQAEASRESAYKSARCLLEEYRPLKTEIDRRRQELLGLSRLPDLNENERHISIEYDPSLVFFIGRRDNRESDDV